MATFNFGGDTSNTTIRTNTNGAGIGPVTGSSSNYLSQTSLFLKTDVVSVEGNTQIIGINNAIVNLFKTEIQLGEGTVDQQESPSTPTSEGNSFIVTGEQVINYEKIPLYRGIVNGVITYSTVSPPQDATDIVFIGLIRPS